MSLNLGKVVIKREDGIYTGVIERNKIKDEEQISSINDVEDYKNYKTLRQFFVNTMKLKINKKSIDETLEKFNALSIWVYDPDIGRPGMKRKEWEYIFYKHSHPLCKSCKKKCKQSSKSEIITCKSYQKK